MEEKKVIIYTTPSCVYCNMLKAFFDEKEVSYESIDVSVDVDKAKYIAEKTGQLGVPVTEIEEEFVIGFDQERISKILGLN